MLSIDSLNRLRKPYCPKLKENAPVTHYWATKSARRQAKEVSLIIKTRSAKQWEDEKAKTEESSAQAERIEQNPRKAKSSAPKALENGEGVKQ